MVQCNVYMLQFIVKIITHDYLQLNSKNVKALMMLFLFKNKCKIDNKYQRLHCLFLSIKEMLGTKNVLLNL